MCVCLVVFIYSWLFFFNCVCLFAFETLVNGAALHKRVKRVHRSTSSLFPDTYDNEEHLVGFAC